MTDHLTLGQIEGYRRKSLPPQELMRTDAHLGGCDSCRRQLRASRPVGLPELLEECADALHLTYEQMTSYLDAPLNDPRANEGEREFVESHRRICSMCDRELRDLEALDVRLAAAETVQQQQISGSFWKKFAQWFAMPQPAAMAAAALLLVVIFVMKFHPPQNHGNTGSLALAHPASHSPASSVPLVLGLAVVAIGAAVLLVRQSRKK